MDREQKIAEIREALEKATPGPWEYEMWEGCADVYPTTGRHVPICQLWTKTEEPMENAENNAHLIANAPEWLGFLLDELERLEREYAEELEQKQQEIERLRAELEDERRQHEFEKMQHDELRETVQKLIEGLRFYVKLNPAYTGHHARRVLKEIGVTTDA